MTLPSPSRRRTLLLIIGLSTLLKLALLWSASGIPPRGDEKQYLLAAPSIVQTGYPAYGNPHWDEAHSSPVFPYVLAACHRLFGEAHFETAVRLIQVLLSALTVLLVHSLALRAFGRRVAMLAAGIAAFFPTLVAYTHYFYGETIYTFLLFSMAVVLTGGAGGLSNRRAFLGGLLGGLAALTRGAFVTQIPFVLLWLVLAVRASWQRRIALAALFLVGAAVAISPWSIGNTIRYDRFLLIDTNAGNVLYKNWNAIRQENHDIGMSNRWTREKRAYRGEVPFRKRSTETNIVERSDAEVRAAVGYVLRYPGRYIRNCVVRAAELVNPTSFLVRAVQKGDYEGLSGFPADVVVLVVVVTTMAVLLFGPLGLAARPPNGSALLAALLVLGNVVVSVLIVSMSRYRFPMMPFAIIFAAEALMRFRQQGLLQTIRERRWMLVVILPLLIWAWVIYVPYSFPAS